MLPTIDELNAELERKKGGDEALPTIEELNAELERRKGGDEALPTIEELNAELERRKGEWVDVKPEEPGSPTLAAIKGGIGGFFGGLWAGGNAAANKIVKAIPEVGIGLESAVGHGVRFAGKGLKAVGAKGVGSAVESAGEGIVGSAAGAKAWLDAKLPSEAKDWLGYEDWSTNASDWVGNAAAMAVKFAPGSATVGGKAFMEAVFASDGANAFANTHDTAIANGASEAEATALGGEAALINYFGGKALMRSGDWAAGVKGAGKQFLASGAASSATMAAQRAGNRMVKNLAERKPLMEGVAGEAGEGLVEGGMYHVYNAIPGYARGVMANRAERQKHEEYIRDLVLEHAKTNEGAAKLAVYLDGPALDEAIRARKAGGKVTGKMASEIGLPDVMTSEEVESVIDAVSSQRRAWAERVRLKMDDVQAQALAETVAGHVGEDAKLFEETWLKTVERLTDARELDDPVRREELVEAALATEGEGPRYNAEGEGPRYNAEGEGPRDTEGEGPRYNAEGEGRDMTRPEIERLGELPVEEVAIGDVEALAPTENGNVIESYDAAKAKPIVVWEDLEGNRHAVTGGKRLAMATASGAETVKAVVIKEADGWSETEARGLGTVENLREGNATLRNVVEAAETIGADQVAEIAGWHQKQGHGEAATMMRRGLAVAQKAGPELKEALAEGRIGEDFAYDAAQVLSMERVGEGWEAAQRELAALVGKVGPEELDAVLWGLRERLAEDGSGVSADWAAAIAEERAKYNEKKGGKSGQLDSDAILMETEDGEMKTLGEMEAESGKNSLTQSSQSPQSVEDVSRGDAAARSEAEAPELAAAQGAGANKAVELQPVAGKPGTFATLSHPKARFTVDGEKKIVAVDGLAPEDFAGANAEKAAALVARVEAYAAENGLNIGFRDDAVMEAWRAARERIKAEAAEEFAAKDREARRVTVVDQLKKSGLAEGVVETAEDFNRMFEEMSGEALRAGEEVYGFVDPKTKKIYLNPDFFATGQGLEAPIHEFGHLGVIAAEKVNKPVYDRGMKLAGEFLENPESAGTGAVRELVDMILNDRVYSEQSRELQAQELLAQLIGKRGAAALKAETNATVVAKVKAWLVEFWNTFGKALGLKDITPEEAEKMTLEDVADAIRAEMLSGRKYGEGLDRVEFANGGARIVTKPTRIKRRLSGRRKAVNEFVKRMGGGEDPANVETDLLALWVDSGGRLFDALPYEETARFTKGRNAKKERSAVADEFAESTAFYRDLDAAQRKVFFGTEKLESGPIGESLRLRLEDAGIRRFTGEDGTVDYEAVIDEFKRQWTNYERGEAFLKERGEWEEERDRAMVEEMERAEQAEYEAVFGKEEGGGAALSAEAAAQEAQIAADIEAGMFSRRATEDTSAVGTADAEKLAFVDTPLSAKSYKEAREILKKKTGKKFTNADSGLSASLSGNSINKILSGKAVAKSVGVKQHLAAAANIVELFEGGELRATEEGNRKGVKNAKRVFARFDLDGEKLVAKITVLEHERDDHRIYSVEAMEVSKAGSILAPKDSKSQAENPALPLTSGIIPQTAAGAQGGKRGPLFSRAVVGLTAGKKNARLSDVDQKRLTAVMRGLGSGELKHPRFTREEFAASKGTEHEQLWNYILSLESPDVDGGGAQAVAGGERKADTKGGDRLGRLRRVATRYGSDPREIAAADHKYFDRGAESRVYDKGDGTVIKVRRLNAYDIDGVKHALAKIVYHNYLFPKDAYRLQDIAVWKNEHGRDEFFMILEQPFVTPKRDAKGNIVAPTEEQIFAALAKTGQRFSVTGGYYDNGDTTSGTSASDAVESAKMVAANGDYAVYDFKPGRNTFIDAETGEVRFIDPRVDINDPTDNFAYSKFGKRRRTDARFDPDAQAARRRTAADKGAADEGWTAEDETRWTEHEEAGSFDGSPSGKGRALFSRSGIFTGTAADYANRSRKGGEDDGPSLKKIGTGEGSQVYGWGLYGSTVRGVAEGYAMSNGGKFGKTRWRKNGEEPKTQAEIIATDWLGPANGNPKKAIKLIKDRMETVKALGLDVKPYLEAIKDLRDHGDAYSISGTHLYEQTFFTNRAPGDESHLLKWYEPVSEEQLGWIRAQAEKEGIPVYEYGKGKTGRNILGKSIGLKVDGTGGNIYEAVEEGFEWENGEDAPRLASEFLARAGIDGVKYPVDSYGGKGVKDGDKAGWNYVSFRDDNIRVDHKWTDGQLRFSRAVKPSALGDGKQRYYEVPFDKAVDKIVKNKKPIGNEHVFISETPGVFRDIGLPSLPVMMNQSHVLSCYFGQDEGVKAGNMHGLGAKLKSLPKAIAKPMMVIANDSNPSSSVIAIVKMQDRDGHTVIAPVEINGIGQSTDGRVTANIVKSAFGKKNIWSEKVAAALRDEVDGKVAVFYVDSNEARTIENRLAREAFHFGGTERQLLRSAKGTVHSIADFGSPVKGVGAQTDSHQFKRWFGGSKVVDEKGEPLVVYRGSEYDPLAQEPGKGVIKPEAYFTADPEYAKRYTGNGGKVQAYYLNIRRPFDIRDPECLADLKKVYPDHEFQKGKSGALDWAEASTIDGEFLKENFGDKYDGIIYDEGGDPTENGPAHRGVSYVPLDGGAQAKSATDNIGTFDPGNNDIRFSRAPEAELVKLTRIAAPATEDGGARYGERTPGAMAASRELSRQAPTPLTQKGTRYVSLPMSEMNALARYLTGHALPAEMESGRKLGAAGKASLKHRKLTIAADVLGVVDKTDAAAETATLKQHGFFKHEDANWCATHSPTEVRQERERSEDALSSRLEALADRRISGREPGGNAAGRKVFADQLAKVVMSMPHGQPGVLGAMQTVAGALEKRVRGNDAEADAFIEWMKGTPATEGGGLRDNATEGGGLRDNATEGGGARENARRDGPAPQERKLEMFAAFLIMPKEMEARAKGWYDAIRSTIAADQKLADAFRKMTARSMSEQGYKHLEAEILRAQDAQTEAAIKKLQAEANEPIKAGEKLDQAKETVILACDDRMGAAVVRVDAAAKAYLAAQKKLMAKAKTPAEKAQIKQQTDSFMGQLAQAKNQAELSRTAWERGRNNADARYLWRMVDLLNEATVRDGLKTQDLSLYLDQMRVIETRGLSGSRGESARQAQLVIDAMKRRLGGDFAKVEAFARKFHAIHEQELLNNPLLEKILGKGTAEYWKSQASYVTTKRTFSPEELAEIEAARRVLAASGAAGGDTVVGQMFKYCGRPETTAKLKGSFADKQEVMSATFEKVAEVQRFLRRSEYVIRLRDMLKLANVEGVHDMPAGKNEFKSNARYGTIGYMEGGHRRVLVVPKEIARGFERQAMYDTGALKICAAVNNVARQLWIDFNPVYWQRNISRNAGSIEMNMPGMRESIIKRGARFVFPGLAPVTEMAMTHIVRHMPERMSLGLRKIWGEHTALFYAPKAKRMAMWITDHSEMQRRLWDAEKRGDLGAVQEMMEDQRDMLAAMRANMLVGLGAGKASGTAGFLDESVRTVGKTMQREMQELAAMPKWRRALNAVNIFEKNAKQQVFEDIMAKFSAYLHDRAQFGTGNNRTAEESGLVVKKNVSIGEGERKGKDVGWVQGLMQPFWNMVEKGVVRNVTAYRERPGETFQKAAWRIAPMLLQGLVGSGALAAWILKANDGDEEKAKNGPMGDVYRYLRGAQRAYQNCSNYVRNNYHVTPLWTDGYTSIIIGMPLTDEERLLKPIARFVADAASVAAGTKEQLEITEFLSDAYGTVAPDFKMAGALVTLLDDTVHPLLLNDNPHDYYTGSEKFDKDLYAVRNESWEMRGKFAAAMAKRLWNDFGGRNVLPVDRAGVDNGLGKAPGWVARALNDIPIASPILRSFVKVQVGSPKRDAAEITEAERKRQAIGRICAKDLFDAARKAKRDVSMDAEKYCGLLQKWEKTYGLTPEELASIEAKYLNAWRAYEGAQYKADGEREKFRAKAEKLGLDAASIWLDFD